MTDREVLATRKARVAVSLPFEVWGPKPAFAGRPRSMDILMLRVQTDDGLVGWGEAFGYAICPATRVAIERLIEAPVLAGSGRENLIRLDIQCLPEMGKAGQAGSGGKKRRTDLAFAPQHRFAAFPQGMRVEPEGPLENVAAEHADERQQRVVGQRLFIEIVGEKAVLVAAPAAEAQCRAVARDNFGADAKGSGLVHKIA